MNVAILATSGILLLLFLLVAFWLGRRLGRADAEPERKAAENNLQDLRMAEALLRQERDGLRQQVVDHQANVGRFEVELGRVRDELKTREAELMGVQATLEGRDRKIHEVVVERDQARAELTAVRESLGAAQKQVAVLQTEVEKDRETLEAVRGQLEESRMVFRQEFENLANQIFEQKHQSFDAQSREGLTSLLAPFKEQLESFRTRVDQVHAENVQGHTGLKGELDRLRELNQRITEEASNLTRALKGDKKVQGNWGEQKVELLLEQSGLRKGIEYSREQNFKDGEGNNLRPDFVVNLPEGKHIIIDSKVSLVDYVACVAAETPEDRQKALAAHVQALRNHIRSLSDKKYPDLLGMDSPDFTFLFIAIEPAYLAAAEHSPTLFQEAYEGRIALVTATTLLPVLRVVANLWSLQRQNQSTRELADQASRVYDKLRVFIEKMERLGGQLEMVQRTYKDSFDTLKDGRGSLVRTVDRFVDLGVKVTKRMPTTVTGQVVPTLECGEDGSTPLGSPAGPDA